MFANTGYVPPAVKRQAMAQTNLKVHYNNIYSMVQSSAAQTNYYAQNFADLDHSPEGAIVNRQSLRTAGNLQHSYSHKGDQIIAAAAADQSNAWAAAFNNEQPNSAGAGQSIPNASSPIQLVRQSFTRTRPRASPQDFATGGTSRNENTQQARVIIPHVSHEMGSHSGKPIDSQWMVGQGPQD